MKTAEQIAAKYWGKFPNIDKYELKRDILQAIKHCTDSTLDDPRLDMMFRPDGYYRVTKPDNQEFRMFRGLKSKLPDRWIIIMPGVMGDKSEETYYPDGSLREDFMKLPALRTEVDLELVS